MTCDTACQRLDAMNVLPIDVLLDWALKELEARDSIFGIHRSQFFAPLPDNPFAVADVFGQYLSTPIGPAAGPHTQLAQNIASAWLCGGRFIELKTVQIRDKLDIPKPCIDMEDEGYNVEWSQELNLEQSAREYAKAWYLIHILHRLLGLDETVTLGTIFNVSVGYNLAGIRDAPLTRFLDGMQDASAELSQIRSLLQERFSRFAGISIPSRIANNVTLSTIHGCPPQEIEQIARYLMEERGLHTLIKLNPTLLGRNRVLEILHTRLGFCDIQVPEEAFEKDLGYPEAVELIGNLQQVAARCGLTFGVKLSNTLPAINHKRILPGPEMYLSGRALYPLTLSLLLKLTEEFDGGLMVSYSGGADALNIGTILTAGAYPVTMATDLLKPGGYARLAQCLQNLERELRRRQATGLDDLWRDKKSSLKQAVAQALIDHRYQQRYLEGAPPKVDSRLELFDCIVAPCVEQCAVHQDIPKYNWLIARGDYDRALAVILLRNPLPGVTGYVCRQLCQECCTRSAGNYDQPVAIRALKRFAAARGRLMLPRAKMAGPKVAIIGSGPAGLSAAYFLALHGIQATIFEACSEAGGMLRLAPAFRLPQEILREDIERILKLGVELELSHPICRPPENLLEEGFDAVFIASGFPIDAPLFLKGADGPDIFGALEFLRDVRRGNPLDLGPKVLVIGGGNTAFDAARAARRVTGCPPTVVYRRTRIEMPADPEELAAALEEGILLEERATPVRVIRDKGRVTGLECVRNEMGAPGADGRRQPLPVAGSEFRIQADSLIVAAGQRPDPDFPGASAVLRERGGVIRIDPATGLTNHQWIYAGGDAVRGPASIIEACADGRRAAESICADHGIAFHSLSSAPVHLSATDTLQVKQARARREDRHQPERIPQDRRSGFELIEATLSEPEARSEANRCLQCSVICDKCVEVCPNRANQAYTVSPAQLIMPILASTNGKLAVVGETVVQIRQSTQIVHWHDLCNRCGNCATFCVHQGKPYEDKPRLFFLLSDFRKESDNAFHIERTGESWTILRRERGYEMKLELLERTGRIVFEDDSLRAGFSCEDFGLLDLELKRRFPGQRALTAAAEMYVIARGITGSLAFLT